MSGELFRPFRALGYITDDVPFAVQRRGKETYVTVSVGRTWQARWVPSSSSCVELLGACFLMCFRSQGVVVHWRGDTPLSLSPIISAAAAAVAAALWHATLNTTQKKTQTNSNRSTTLPS